MRLSILFLIFIFCSRIPVSKSYSLPSLGKHVIPTSSSTSVSLGLHPQTAVYSSSPNSSRTETYVPTSTTGRNPFPGGYASPSPPTSHARSPTYTPANASTATSKAKTSSSPPTAVSKSRISDSRASRRATKRRANA